MNLKPYLGQFVTLVLDPEIKLPGLEYFQTIVVDGQEHHIVVPAAFAPRPAQAIAPEGNVVLNALVQKFTEEEGEYDLLYAPWMTAPKNGPKFSLRLHENFVLAVVTCLAPPPDGELDEVIRAEERRRMEAEAPRVAPSPLIR